MEKTVSKSHGQSSNPVIGNLEVASFQHSLFIETLVDFNNPDMSINDSHLPIAMRKSSCTCASKYKYLISHYVSSHHLSRSYYAFANQLSSISIPQKL